MYRRFGLFPGDSFDSRAYPYARGAAAAAGTLLYDADCGFCQWSLRKARDTLPIFPATQAYQLADLPSLGLTAAAAQRAVWYIAPAGGRWSGHLAIAKLLRAQPLRRWRLLGGLLQAPGISLVASLVYRWIADHRYLLPGATDACELPHRR